MSRVLITAGPTREHLDDVRFVSNASSGKMGYALAAEAVQRGHDVTLVSGPVELPPPRKVTLVSVTSAQEMLEACLIHFMDCNAAILCAAVCDYRPIQRTRGKPAKHAGPIRIEFEPTPDIAATLGAVKGGRILIGFALESDDGRFRAEAKLRAKRCDAIVLNGPGSIGGDASTIETYTPDMGWSKPETLDKRMAAIRIIDLLEGLTGVPDQA